jgi:ribosomal subunit interface protein
MNVTISAIKFKADQKLETFISDKLEKLSKLHDGIIGSEVTLKLDNTDKPENKVVDIRVKIKGNDAIASKAAKTFEEATDLTIEALKKQLVKSKEKERSK